MADDEAEVDVLEILARLNAENNDLKENDDAEITENIDSENIHNEPLNDTNEAIQTTDSQQIVKQNDSLLKKGFKSSGVHMVRESADEQLEQKKRDILAEHADNISAVNL